MKLNRAIDILSKLRYNASLSVLKTIYHSLFGSHLLYGFQIWRQKNLETQTTFQTLQNRALKKITFKNRRDSAICIYKDLKILNFRDHIAQQNCIFVFSLKQSPQLLFSSKIFHCGHTQHFSTKSASKNILDIPYSQTYSYGTKSVTHSCIKDWNNFERSFPNLFQGRLTYSRIKLVLTNHLLNQY